MIDRPGPPGLEHQPRRKPRLRRVLAARPECAAAARTRQQFRTPILAITLARPGRARTASTSTCLLGTPHLGHAASDHARVCTPKETIDSLRAQAHARGSHRQTAGVARVAARKMLGSLSRTAPTHADVRSRSHRSRSARCAPALRSPRRPRGPPGLLPPHRRAPAGSPDRASRPPASMRGRSGGVESP